MPRITRAGGVSDVRAVPERTVGPSVDEMLRRPEPPPEPDEPLEAEVVEAIDVTGAEPAGGPAGEDPGAGVPEDGGGDGDEPVAAPSTADVRAWALDNGFELAASGPIPKDVQAAYDDAHPAAASEG